MTAPKFTPRTQPGGTEGRHPTDKWDEVPEPPKAGDRCSCGVGPEHCYDASDIAKMRDALVVARRNIHWQHDLAAMTPQERHAIDCYAGAFRRKCKHPDHA